MVLLSVHDCKMYNDMLRTWHEEQFNQQRNAERVGWSACGSTLQYVRRGE